MMAYLKPYSDTQIRPIVITVEHPDGTEGTVALLWNKELGKMELEVKNAEIDQGAKKLFKHILQSIEQWQEEFYQDQVKYKRKFAIAKG